MLISVKMDNMQEQMGNMSRKMETKKKKSKGNARNRKNTPIKNEECFIRAHV